MKEIKLLWIKNITGHNCCMIYLASKIENWSTGHNCACERHHRNNLYLAFPYRDDPYDLSGPSGLDVENLDEADHDFENNLLKEYGP